jgi:hypothetical protein
MAKTSLQNLATNKPSLFTPTVNRLIADPSSGFNQFLQVDGTTNVDTNIQSTSSFMYALPGQGIKSTQQLNVDWSAFENHCFYNSAQVKTNVAFDKVFNRFPFDGTNRETEAFFDGLSGFEKWVYDEYPKYKGYLFFSGTRGSQATGGTYITVRDSAGAAYQSVSRLTTGAAVLSPYDDSMTIEFYVYLPTEANSNAVIYDKHIESGNEKNGIYVGLSQSAVTTYASMSFYVLSGTSHDTVTVGVTKGQWQHVAFVWDRTPGVCKIRGYVDGVFAVSSSRQVEFGTLIESGSNAYIGSGSSVTSLFVPTTTLSGALDEFRLWHSIRSVGDLLENRQKAIFATGSLKLYFRLDEPSGSNSALVIDHSANSLHGRISSEGLTLGVRETTTGSVAGSDPMVYQKLSFAPVLFPQHEDVQELQSLLLTSASIYDLGNPSLITRQIPKHYLSEGQAEEGFDSVQGQIIEELTTGTDPRSAKLGGTQTFLLILYTWAQFFDEMKLFTQAFSDINFVDYDSEDTVPDQFLMQLARSQGIELPPLFTGASAAQFLGAENIGTDISTNSLSLQYIQNQIWRRILVNLREILKSKGTIDGIKYFIRAVGVDPDNNFRIREYGGPTKKNLAWVRDSRFEISTMLDFVSGGLINSAYLSQSRTEPGWPYRTPAALQVSDDWLTSGSWTYEGIYRYAHGAPANLSQSLAKMFVTGNQTLPIMPLNVVAVSGTSRITLHTKPGNTAPSEYFTLVLSGADIFDGNQWYVSFGRQRNDDPSMDPTSIVSSSYFLRAARQSYGEIAESYTTSSFFNDYSGSAPVWSTTNFANVSGAWISIGSQSIAPGTSVGLAYETEVPSPEARFTKFDGRVSQIRFWSKYLSETEYPEHVRNYKSLGVTNPDVNFNFVTNQSGSWERLRLDVSTDQMTTQSNASGQIQLFDFSQNQFHFSGTLFEATSSVVQPERFYFSYISPKYDEAATTNKIRIRSFEDYANVAQTPWAQVAPVYDLPRSETPTDSTRFSIDFSVVDALDQDIIGIFATLDELENVLGNPELLYSADYPGLDILRKVYFQRLTGKMNLKLFFEFFKWFDTNIGTFISQLLPRKTKFLGSNYVIESHMLERNKVEYQVPDIYFGDSNRSAMKDVIFLKLFDGGAFRRY